MNLQVMLYDRSAGRRVPILLQVELDTPMAEIIDALDVATHGQPLFLGNQRLTTTGRLGESGLREGSLLSVGEPEAPKQKRQGWELVVVSGPSAGQIEPLKRGPVLVGTSPGQPGVAVNDRSMRSRHFQLFVTHDEVTVAPVSLDTRVYIDGDAIGESITLDAGQVIRAGASLIEIRPAPIPDADITIPYGTTVEFNRPPRIRPPRVENKTFHFPNKPEFDPDQHPFPWVQTIAPLIVAVAGVLLFHQLYFLLFGLLSPVMAVGTLWERKRQTKKREKREKAKYTKKRREVEANAKQAAITELHAFRYLHPDSITIADLVTEPRKRLWERRRDDPDFLELRVGTAHIPSGVHFQASQDEKIPEDPALTDAPVTFDLKKTGILGVAAGLSKRRAIGRWLMIEAAALHSPRDLRMCLFTSEDAAPDWDWVRWLPHMRNDRGGIFANVAVDQYQHDELVRELLGICEQRMEQLHERNFDPTKAPSYIVVLDGIRELRAHTSLPRLLADGPKVGIYAIGLDSVSSRLAEEGRAELVIDNDIEAGARLHVSDQAPVENMSVDLVDAQWASRVARAMAALVDVTGRTAENSIPASASFVELVNIDLDSPASVLESWKRNGRTTNAVLGIDDHGTFSLDLRRDGPHALVAGTTGAGKSEFLQTLVASLAYANRPEAMNFVLVDYKGGSAFADCARLPHTVGMVTDLDGHLTERALTALDAELKRREGVLKQIGAADIDDAWRQDPKTASQNLARLVIVIDEFAELVHELPEFVDGLIRIARVGRSLGVHLILATQRPSGVVSPEIRSNTGVRIALRMEDRADSQEVIERPDAASISRATPGRAFAKLGGAGSLTPFQSARIAGLRRGQSSALPPVRVHGLPWNRLGTVVTSSNENTVEGSQTDLHFLVERIREAAQISHVSPQRSPWLPPLPDRFVLTGIGEGTNRNIFAVEDRPSQQAQPFRAIDLEHDGHILIAGSPRSGRSSALRTIAALLADTWSPDDLHMYGMDFGNGALLPFAELPHCGAVTLRHEHERLDRLLRKILDEIAARQQLLARGGFGDINEQRRNSPESERLPFIALFFDQWDGFLAEFPIDLGTDHQDLVMQIVREGASVGLHVYMTGDRLLVNHRISTSFTERLLLHLNSKDDYGIAGLRPREISDHMPPGRAVDASDSHELQIGILSDSDEVVAQVAVLRKVAARQSRQTPLPRLHPPFRVDALPTAISFAEALDLPQEPSYKSPLTCLVGVAGDELTGINVDLQSDGPYFIIGGQPKSGRSTAALQMAKSSLHRGATVVALTPKASPLRAIAAEENSFVFSGNDDDLPALRSALESADGPVLVVIDDCDRIRNSQTEDYLRELAAHKLGEVGVVLVGLIEDLQMQMGGLVSEARKSHMALLISPQSTMDGDLAGLRLDRSLLGRQQVAGRAVLCINHTATFAQIPT